MAIHKLQAAMLSKAAPGEHHDGGGLYLVVRSQNSASWHLRFSLNGRRHKMGLGSYPEVSLARARDLARENRSLAAEGKNPVEIRNDLRRQGMTVERALVELFEKKKASLKDNGSAGRWWSPVANHILPAIGKVGVADLTVQMIVDKLGKVYVEKPDTGDKVFFRLKSALEYASAQDDRVRPDVVDRAKVQLPRRRASKYRQDEGHHPALDYRDAPRLWGSLDLGDVVDAALAFYLLTLPRVANVAHMRWPQVDFRKAVWTIPPENMKTGVAFDAPLVPPALRILRGAKRFAFKGSDDLVFPNPRGRKTRIHHVNFLNNRLKQGGWQSTSQDKLAVAHGLRSTFSSYVVSETSHGARLAEMSIQHEVRTKQERAYNRADLLDKRREVLGDWAEFVLSLSARRAATASRLRSVAEPHGDRTMLDVERWLRPPAEDRWE